MEDSIEALRKKLNREKAEMEVRIDMERRNEERKQLKKQLRDLQIEKIKKSKIVSGGKKTINFFDKLASNYKMNIGKEKSGKTIGETVTINNGIYSGKRMKISRFIEGGIEGNIDGSIVRIRHGSYN